MKYYAVGMYEHVSINQSINQSINSFILVSKSYSRAHAILLREIDSSVPIWPYRGTPCNHGYYTWACIS